MPSSLGSGSLKEVPMQEGRKLVERPCGWRTSKGICVPPGVGNKLNPA